MSAGGPNGAVGDARLLRRTWRRLILWSGGITLAILVVLGAAIYLAVDRSLSDSIEQRLRDRAGQIADFIGRAPGQPASLGPQLQTGIVFGGPSSGTLALVIGPANESVGPQNSRYDGLPDMDAVAAARAGSIDVRQMAIEGTPIQLVSEPVVRSGQTYVIQVIADRTAEARALQLLLVVLIVGGVAALGLSVGVGRSTRAGRSSRSATRSGASASSPPTPATNCARRWLSSVGASNISCGTPPRRLPISTRRSTT